MSRISRWTRPRDRAEAIWQIEETFQFNKWNEDEQAIFLADLGLEKNWREFDNAKLKKILRAMERDRMILYK